MELILIDGQIIKYSPEDHERVSLHKWSLKDEGYAGAKINRIDVRMNRFIMSPVPDDKVVNHKNGDRLDNRRSNLEIISQAENAKVRLKAKGTTSKYKGVVRVKDKYQAYIKNDYKRISLGSHATEEDAAEAYDRFIVANNFAHNLNFPEKRETYAQQEPVCASLLIIYLVLITN